MEDVSELFKIHFNLLHKGTTVTKSVQDRKEVHNNARKAKRDTLAFLRRNIDENLSPINSPTTRNSASVKNTNKIQTTSNCQGKIPINAVAKSKPAEVSKRFELLQKWKTEKAKQKKQEKAKAKPLFKVCHISSDITLDIDKANKVIKGKPFIPKSQFAPPNHQFKPPKGIEPLSFNASTTQQPASTTSGRSKLKFTPQAKTGHDPVNKKRLPACLSNSSKKSVKQEPGTSKHVSATKENKKETSKPNTRKNLKEIVNPDMGKFNKYKGENNFINKSQSSIYTSDYRISPSVCVNPFVTISRGKSSARKEYQRRKSQGKGERVKQELSTSKHVAATKAKTAKPNTRKNLKEIAKPDLGKFDKDKGENNFINRSQSSVCTSDYKIPPPVYVSPFVTISRGKSSAREEYQIRKSQSKTDFDENSPEVIKILTAHTSPKARAAYFKYKLDREIERIFEMCNNWEKCLEDPDLPEEAHSSIDVTIGQSKLLISKKFQQFRSLITQYETEKFAIKPVTCEDLHGFWDMLYMQVEDLDKRFLNVQKLKDNNWNEILPQKVSAVKKLRGRPKKAQTKSKLVQMIQEARKKQKEQPSEDVNLIDLIVKEAKTPLKERPQEEMSSTLRKSLRLSMVNRENKSRCNSSPGLTMMKISQSIKQGDGFTPVLSILKTDVFRSTGNKSVVFKENIVKPLCKTNLFNEQEKENISDNLINFSPAPLTPRRLSRISKLKM